MIGPEERAAAAAVLEGPILVHGPRIAAFEADFAAFTGAPRAVATGSCTAAMHLAYHAMGLGPGDEVIVPAQSHVATAHAVALTGAKPVFADCELPAGNMTAAQVAPLVNGRTRAIAVVHYNGIPVDMPPIMEIAQDRGLAVLEDCALAVGAWRNGVHVGLFGDVGCFSFYPIKHMTTLEGGMAIGRNEALLARMAHLRALGVDRSHGERAIPGEYDVSAVGFNYRMNELQAAIGSVQVSRLPVFLEQRRCNAAAVAAVLADRPDVSLIVPSDDEAIEAHYCAIALLAPELADHRPAIMAEMKAQGLGCSIYYPRAIPDMTCYREPDHRPDVPNARRISASTIALPVGPHLDNDDAAEVARGLCRAIDKENR